LIDQENQSVNRGIAFGFPVSYALFILQRILASEEVDAGKPMQTGKGGPFGVKLTGNAQTADPMKISLAMPRAVVSSAYM
jgi:hypothetical protein